MAYTPLLQTKQDLATYILAQLGDGVLNVELTDAQIYFAIDNAVELYMQNAYSGTIERFSPLQIVAGQVDYILPYEVFAIISIRTQEMGGITNSAPSNIFSMNQFIASDLYKGSGRIDLLTYETTNELLSTLDIMFSKKVTFDFNCISKVLHLFEIPIASETAMVQCYIKNVPTYTTNTVSGEPDIESSNIYNELILRNLATSYARKQHAINLLKYEGSVLPNGLTLNASAILSLANEEVIKYEEQLINMYSLLPDFYIG